MRFFPSALFCSLLLTVGSQNSIAAGSEKGFWNGLGGAFSEMGRSFKDVVTGQTERTANLNTVGRPAASATAIPRIPQNGKRLVYEVQYRLSALGYSPGPVDGMMGKKTAAAISAFQGASGLPADGRPSSGLVAALRSQTPSLSMPSNSSGIADPGASTSSPLTSALGGLVGSLSKVMGSTGGGGDMQSGAASLASQLSQSAAGGGSGQSNAEIALALGALAATAAGPSASNSAQYPTGLNPTPAAVGMGPSNDSAAVISSLAQGVAATRGVPLATQPARPQGQSYLDAMVAEGDAEVYRRARTIDPQTREMAQRAGVDIDRMVARQLTGYEQYKRDAAEIERRDRQDPNFIGMAYPHVSGNLPGSATHASQRSSSGPQPLPSILAGSWEGDVTYEPHRISAALPRKYAQHMRVRLDADPQRGLVSVMYPELGCTGILRANMSVPTKAGVNEHELVDYPLVEQLASNSGKCADGGTVYLSHWAAYQPPPAPRKGQLWFRWVNPSTKENAMHGRLLPVSNAVDTKAIDQIAARSNQRYVASVSDKFADQQSSMVDIGGGEDSGPYCGSGKLQELLVPEYACFGLGGVLPYAACAAGTLIGYKPVYFGVACKAHDQCYSRKDSQKSTCDRNFLTVLEATCDTTLTGKLREVGRKNCHNTVSEYFHQVSTRGCEAFEMAQRRAGNNAPNCD